MTKAKPTIIKLAITERDIKLGVPEDDENCAIARACKRAGLRKVKVYNYAVRWNDDRCGARLPKKASVFIERFDDEEKRHLCKPFSFTIRRPAGC